jgi:hypothetical protein
VTTDVCIRNVTLTYKMKEREREREEGREGGKKGRGNGRRG